MTQSGSGCSVVAGVVVDSVVEYSDVASAVVDSVAVVVDVDEVPGVGEKVSVRQQSSWK